MQDALRRRGGGFEVGGLLENCHHEKIVGFLLRSLRKPMLRADYVPPTIADALACDKEIFAKLSKLCSRDASGIQSLPTYIPPVLDHAEIVQLMVPKIGATRKR